MQKFETPARRFASNGYPPEHIEAHEYDSTFTVTTVEQVYAGLDQRIDRLLAGTGRDQVDLAAHSLGTALMQGYLNSSPARAARVAHYVNLDGASAASPPGGVPTLAIWGEGDPARAVSVAITWWRMPSMVSNRDNCAPGCGRSRRTMNRGAAPWLLRRGLPTLGA